MIKILYIECEFLCEWSIEKVEKIRKYILSKYLVKHFEICPAERLFFYVDADLVSAEEDIETYVKSLE